MKVTKDQLIEAFITGVVDINFNFKDDTLKLVLEDPKMSREQFENVVGWLTEINFSGYNQIRISYNTSLTGIIYLTDVISDSKKLNLTNSRLHQCRISNSGEVDITDSKIQDSSISPTEFVVAKVIIKRSDIGGHDIVDSLIDHSRLLCKSLDKRSVLSHSNVIRSILYTDASTIENKSFSSVVIDAGQFNGDYFSIGFNGEIAVGYLNKAEKVIVMGEKRYNLGSWEEQFIKKEQNQFVRMMNQKKLEMMNMFFDSLAFK